MEDMFEELGPTKFIRGSHIAGRRPAGANHYKGMPAQSLMVKGGDCVMFRCDHLPTRLLAALTLA